MFFFAGIGILRGTPIRIPKHRAPNQQGKHWLRDFLSAETPKNGKLPMIFSDTSRDFDGTGMGMGVGHTIGVP